MRRRIAPSSDSERLSAPSMDSERLRELVSCVHCRVRHAATSSFGRKQGHLPACDECSWQGV